MNVIVRMTKDGRMKYDLYTRNMTGAVFVEFLEAWTARSPRKLYLIFDRRPSHRSRVVEEWLAARADRLRIRAKISCRISIDSKGWFMSFYDHAGS
ncbi:MAG: transposase [Planctomycetia bacterium]